MREGGSWGVSKLDASRKFAGTAEVFEKSDMSKHYHPGIRPFDRYGMRINQVEYHPTYHELMALAIEHEVPNFAWNHPQSGCR